MNFYNLHSDPKSLNHHDTASEQVPKLAWEKYKTKKGELKKREHIWAKDAEFSYLYSTDVLNGPFVLGEPAIAKSAEYSWMYAEHNSMKRFELGEPAIAKNSSSSYAYASKVIKAPFKLGEAAIATDGTYSYWYAKFVLKAPFKLGELAIANDDHDVAEMYARDVLRMSYRDATDWKKSIAT